MGFSGNHISGETYNNIIGDIFEQNEIVGSFYKNKTGYEFKGSLFLGNFYLNTVGSYFGSNQFSGSTSRNNIGDYTHDNDFLGEVYANSWKTEFYDNTIGNEFNFNDIQNNFHSNGQGNGNIGSGFQYNQIGNFFNNNTIGDNFGFGSIQSQGNKIGNNFYHNTVGEYFYNNSIPDNFYENEIGNYFQWNIINTDINNTSFALNYGNITGFSYTSIGTGATDDVYYDMLICGDTQTMGVDAAFDIEVSGGTVIGVTGSTQGRLYSIGDVLTIRGNRIGGVTGVIDGFSSDAIGKSGVTGSYTNVIATGTGGENATFDINVTSGLVDGIAINNGGGSYSVGETLTIAGGAFDGPDDITITVDTLYSDDVVITVTGATAGSLFYDHYTKQIFERKGGSKRVSFYDEDDILTIDSVYLSAGYDSPVYSQPLSFPIAAVSFNFQCDGGYVGSDFTTSSTVYNMTGMVEFFNAYPSLKVFGRWFDNNDGTIGLYPNSSSYRQDLCPSGAFTINVFEN
jgi:hypothetical protein